jgi:fructuronate reductase
VTGSPAHRLSRAAGDGAPAAPVRIVHLGLGNFFRAHQAFYTAAAPDAAQWGIAAFTGHSSALADALTAQDGLFTLITRGPETDTAQVIGSISRAHPGTDQAAWLAALADPALAVVTLTVTEAGYQRRSDVATRLVAGLAARRTGGGGPLAVVSCDNLSDNGARTADAVADQMGDRADGLAAWIADNVSFVTTMVDRITPAPTDVDGRVAGELTGRVDAVPVVTEPFREWVLSGEFPAGRPAWDEVGAQFVDGIGPYEQRKLRLLNGGHSLLAYAGSARGHATVADAVADPVCRRWLDDWFDEAAPGLALPAAEIAGYRRALIVRFSNPRIRHLLAQIAADGSQKLPIRVLPTVASIRASGALPTAGLRIIAAWINHLRGAGAPVNDVAAEVVIGRARGPLTDAVPAIVDYLDAGLAHDPVVVQAVLGQCHELSR